MNTQGWMRGLMAKNSRVDEFLKLVTNTISMEFEMEYNIEETETNFIITFNNKYKITITPYEAKWMQNKSPYSLDKHILENLRNQGLEYDNNRSQYVKYCNDIFN
ncbi:hypothetical protein HYG86_14330 [Alkalicella caledoniensis]|uniref:Uncharacterized protein n=1 Tax=Alkalicella caledoniensis TaxID=2731377 RepID=A0A7G9WAZ8_ALKCA|nr:hypothetical protein [Alkalicella caledoniensis]QNO15860.1 hypothetical protein HYG86_14330 [Alkalicella caledoniensis]